MDYDASKNTVESYPAAESDQAGTMLQGKDGYMPGMSDGHADTVESTKISRGKTMVAIGIIVAVVAVIAVIIVVVNGMKVDYSGSYRIAKELKASVKALRADEDCKKVVTNADPTYVKMETFMTYVEACRDAAGNLSEAIENLGKTEGVQRNGDVLKRYETFSENFEAVTAGDAALSEVLKYYEAWHQWVIAKDALPIDDKLTDAEVEKAASYLTKSGNKELKEYGEGWLKKKQAALTAYRAWMSSDILAKNRNELLKASTEAQKAYADYEAKNAIDIKELVPLERVDVSKAYASFEEMYGLIKENYEKNYARGSGDCLETLTDVVCD